MVFDSTPKSLKEQQAINLIQSEQHISIARTDLNGDGINELFLKQDTPECLSQKKCHYNIIAFKDNRTPHIIASFQAHDITVSDHKTYGIRDIIAYKNPLNDYAVTRLEWDPFSSAYKQNTAHK